MAGTGSRFGDVSGVCAALRRDLGGLMDRSAVIRRDEVLVCGVAEVECVHNLDKSATACPLQCVCRIGGSNWSRRKSNSRVAFSPPEDARRHALISAADISPAAAVIGLMHFLDVQLRSSSSPISTLRSLVTTVIADTGCPTPGRLLQNTNTEGCVRRTVPRRTYASNSRTT